MSDLQTLVAQESAKQLASFTADATVKKVLNYLKSSGGLPLGHLFAWPFQTPPDGAIQCNGAEYNRALYADFFAHASSKGWVKTESEWQQIASANGGFCSWYSDGDGSTTFRTPKFAPFMQVAIASGNVGDYHGAGLPGITGKISPYSSPGGTASGAFVTTSGNNVASRGSGAGLSYEFDASNSSSIYGKSTTVQPESSEWMICVVVFGVAANVGSADVGNVMSAVAQVQANPNLQGQAHIVESWKSGSSWYRVWSDGFIEQGGYFVNNKNADVNVSITFHKAFASTNILMQKTLNATTSSNLSGRIANGVHTITTTSFQTWVAPTSYMNGFYWYACGY